MRTQATTRLARRSACRLAAAARALDPGYFAVVMASGIVSTGLRDRLPALSAALLWFAVAAYLLLAALTLWRVAAYRPGVRADLADPRRAFGFFTFVAGTGVLGSRLLVAGHTGVAVGLLGLTAAGWLVLAYAVPALALAAAGRPVAAAADGTWFLWVVATQSVAVLAALLEPVASAGRRELALLAVCCWSVGAGLYLVVAGLVVARITLFRMGGHEVTPSYWISTGATAITVLAGAAILGMSSEPTLLATRTVVAGGSVLFWAFGSWLVPPLLVVGWRRHRRHRVPLTYEPGWWSIVFPLGMYGVATRALGAADHIPVLGAVGRYEEWLALAAWAVVLAAMCRSLGRAALRPG